MTASAKGAVGGARRAAPGTPSARQFPAVLSHGFRPFFLLGAFYAGLIILAWLPLLHGLIELASAFSPLDWHVHETMFGFVAAIVGGFLLTAIPNWTGRLPVRGLPLLALVLLWLAGRVAVLVSGEIGWVAAAIVDCLFLAALAAAAAKEIVAGRNWRNLKMLAPVTLFFLANVLFHVEAGLSGTSFYGGRLAIATVLVLIMIVGGRIIPSFTRNWLAREIPGRLPAPFGRFDGVTIALSTVALLLWTVVPDSTVSGNALVAAAALNLVRLARWAGDRTGPDVLVLILHVAYLFLPTGFLLAGLATLAPAHVPAIAAVHAFGVGTMGTMTLAVMTRATLGHTGRALKADLWTSLIYLAIVLAAVLRIVAGFIPDVTWILYLSATCWMLAFFGYGIRYGGMLLRLARAS
ncbi:NnrS family protein [Stella sp.]|uniref:NnrS family protein n=1 Tax=Stella sp. TaxID=2912054 RepID=UPI0035B14E5C